MLRERHITSKTQPRHLKLVFNQKYVNSPSVNVQCANNLRKFMFAHCGTNFYICIRKQESTPADNGLK